MKNIDIDIDIDMAIFENIDIDIDIDKAILQNIDIDKISNRFKFGISNRAICAALSALASFLKTGQKENKPNVVQRN